MTEKIKTITIKAQAFFEMLQLKDKSMWDLFAEMIDEQQEQLIIFLDETEKEVAHYILPTNIDRLQEDKKMFADSFKQKLNAKDN